MKLTDKLQHLRFRCEELRLIYGKKLEIFLLRNLQILGNLIAKFFDKPKAKFFCCTTIVASSIYLGSIRDIGPNSAQLLLNLLEVFPKNTLSSSLSFENTVLAAVLLTNLLGIFSLWLCSSILGTSQKLRFFEEIAEKDGFSEVPLAKSHLASDQLIANLLIICFTCAIFLSGNLIQANELLSASSLILPALFPLFCIYLASEGKEFKQQNLIIFGALIALLPIGLKPFFPQNFFNNFPSNFSGNFSSKIEEFFIENLLPILPLIALNFRLIWANSLLQKLLRLLIVGSLLSLALFEDSFEQKRLFFAFALPLVSLIILKNFRLKLIDFRKNFLLILAVFIAAIANSAFVSTCIELLIFFWFLLPLLSRRKWKNLLLKSSSQPAAQLKKKWNKILIFSFIAFFALFVAILFLNESAAILLGSLMFLAYLTVQQKLLVATKKPEFSSFSVFFLALTLANFTNIALQSFTRNSEEGKFASNLEAQNAAIGRNFWQLTKKGQKLLIFSNNLRDIQPIQGYLNGSPNPDFSKIPFEQILKTGSGSDFSKKLISALENQDLGMLIFFDNDPCKTSLKESLLANPEFRKVFKKNFYFVNEVKAYATKPRPINFFAENSASLTEDEKFALNDQGLVSSWAYRFEVYFKKQ